MVYLIFTILKKLSRLPQFLGKTNLMYGGYKHSCFTLPEIYGSLPQLAGNQRRSTEGSHNLRETSGDVRKSRATCRKVPENGGSPAQLCGKPTAVAGSLAQLAGNKMQLQEITNKYVYDKMQLQEVSHNLQETNCNCRKSPATCGKQNAVFHRLFGNRNGKLVFLLLDVYRFAFPETQFIKPFPSEPDFRDDDEVMAALLVTSVDFNFS